MEAEQALAILILVATLAAFGTFAWVAWVSIRQREEECRADPSKC